MSYIADLINLILHVDQHLVAWTQEYGILIYALLFLIVFCETGLIVTPVLPGDSLLFAAGALTAIGSTGENPLSIWILSGILISAAFIGDQVNCTLGRYFGDWILKSSKNKWLKREHIFEAQKFLDKHGSFAIVLARFAPFIRTFVPFVAGIGRMNPRNFLIFNFLGAFIWVETFLWLGHFFGNIPVVQKNFTLVILGIVAVSLLPMVYAGYSQYKSARQNA